MAGITATDITTYIGQYKSQNCTAKSLTAIAAAGDETAIEAASPGTGRRWVIQKIVLDVDTAGETLLIEDVDDAVLLTLRFPVADTYIFNNLNLEVTAAKGFNFDKGTVAAIKGWVVYKSIKAGDPVAGA